MSITKLSLLAVTTAVWGPGAWADSQLPDHLRLVAQATQAGPEAPSAAARWPSARAPELGPVTYLAEATVGARAWPESASGTAQSAIRLFSPRPSNPDAAEPGDLVEALTALGPTGVSMADYLSLALPGLLTDPSNRSGPTLADAGRARGTPLVARPALSFLPVDDSALATPRPKVETRQRWALPDRLTRYLFLAAAAATLVAGVGLILARLARRGAAPALSRF